ncbi:MAG: class I SAM-dependent methyltransferase, partial [Chloroflexi bacterium]|nr:class I SAM-dependent methyltransferase [Chloroflexota bacterium]
DIKQQVRQFYDQVGWQEVSEGVYQNAHYEDLRPVAREYIHRCHLRVLRHIAPSGRILLDAGSGPIQYPQYLEYSRGYAYRLCADISITALREARKRIGDHGLYVVADVARLPFKDGAFDGVVSLHTIHHLPEEEHLLAYRELQRTLAAGRSAAVVNGWPGSRLMRAFNPLIRLSNRLRNLARRLAGGKGGAEEADAPAKAGKRESAGGGRKGTFTSRHDAAWVRAEIGAWTRVDIYPWRSASVRFLRALIHPWLGGRAWLRLLFWLEERYPAWFGENGQYPLIVMHKR